MSLRRWIAAAPAVALALGLFVARAQPPAPKGAPTAGEAPSAAQVSPTPAEEARIPLHLEATDSGGGIRSPGYYLLRSLVSLAIVAALVYAAAAVLRELRRRPLVGRRGGSIEVLESAALGPGQTLHLVSVRGQLLLIGATPQGIRVLKEIRGDGPAHTDDTSGAPSPPAPLPAAEG
jgi:flagellar biosynthetic protein FliO